MSFIDPPTSGDYAYAAAQDASARAKASWIELKELTDRVEVLENVLRANKLLPPLELDPEPWVWNGSRYADAEHPSLRYARALKPRKGYEQDISKYGDYREQ